MTSKHFLTTMDNRVPTQYHLLDQVAQVRFYRALHHTVFKHVGLLPEQLDLRMVGLVLDLACGPGFWVHDVAARYPHLLEVVGLDHDEEMVQCAMRLTPHTLNRRAQFMKDDMLDSILGRRCVDLVHLRFLASAVSPLTWPEFIKEVTYLCRPGGFVVWTEAQVETNSAACTELYTLLQRALGNPALSVPVDITPMMDVMLGDTLCQHIERSTVQLDLSAGTPLHASLLLHMVEIVSILQPFFLAKQVGSVEAVDRVCRELMIALYDNDAFTCRISFVTVMGRVPLA